MNNTVSEKENTLQQKVSVKAVQSHVEPYSESICLCPGRPGEADLWREPRSSMVGGHLSHSVWPARASWILTSDPPTGGGQKGQVM